MRTTMVALSCVFAGVLGACEGAQVRRLLDKDAVPDTSVDVETDVDPNEPSLEFWFVGKAGEIGRGEDSVTLVPGDEPDDYLPFPGFQIDLALETRRVAASEDVSLFVDGTLIAVVKPEVSDGVGTAVFRSVTVPDLGSPVVVRVETRDVDGATLTAEKTVGFESGECQIFVQLGLGDNLCVEVGAFGANAFVTLESGACTTATATATVAGEVVDLGEATFDGDGELFFEIPIADPTGEGVVKVEVEALAAGQVRGRGDAEGRYDAVAPSLDLVFPAEGEVVSTLDDADGDLSNGLQVEVEVDLGLDAGEGATLSLTVGDGPATEATVEAGGAFTFPAVTLADSGLVRFVVTATDGCGNTTSVEREVLVLADPGEILVVMPADGAVLLAADDGDPSSTTVYETTFEVVTASVAVGSTLSVECRVTGNDPWVTVGTRTLADGDIAANGRYTIAVAVDVTAGQAQQCQARVDAPTEGTSPAIAVTFGIPPGTLTVSAPVSGACVTSAAVTFEGRAVDSVGLEVSLVGTGPDGDLGPVGLGSVSGEPDVGAWAGTFSPTTDGAYTLEVRVADRFGNPLSEGPVEVTVDRLPPSLAFVSPGVTVNGTTTPDADTGVAGYQIPFVVGVNETTSAEGGEVCIAVNGAAPRCLGLAVGGAQVTFEGVTLVTGPNVVTLTGRDGCGNAAPVLTRTVTLTYDNNLAIVSPAAGTTLLARDDANATTSRVFDGTFVVEAREASVGARLGIECRPAGTAQAYTPVGSTTIAAAAADGRYNLTVAIDTALLGNEIECRATADLPAPNESPIVALTVGLPAPTALLSAPVAGACLNDDVVVAGTATGLDGRTLSARLLDGAGSTAASADAQVAAGAFTTLVALGSTADGPYMVTVAGTDRFGNSLADGAAPMVAVTVDRTAPVAEITSPQGSVVEQDDVDPVAPGIQVDVVVQVTDANPDGDVCATRNNEDLGCVVAVGGVATFASVTLQPGQNDLAVLAEDTCGNLSEVATAQVLLLGESPIVTITEPAADLITAALQLDFVVTVEDPETGGPLSGLEVTLFRDDEAVVANAVDNGDGTYTFAAVPLVPGTTASYVAVAVDFAAIGNSGPRVVTQKNQLPTIAVTSPADGAVLSLASVECAAGPDTTCQATVTATTTNAEDGSEALLTATCGGAPQQVSATVGGGSVSFTGVALPHAATCTLVPEVTDVADQTATGPSVTVTVDRVAPNIAITAPSSVLVASSDQDPGTPGVQAALRADVGGVPPNTTVTAVLTWEGGAQTRSLTATITDAVAEGGAVSVSFEDTAGSGLVTWPEGVVVVTVSASDAAGNPGSATRNVSVVSDASVRITGPNTPVADTCAPCGAGTTCNSGTCWLMWGVNSARSLVVVANGLQTSADNVRVCSDEPGLDVPGAIVCDTAPSARGPYRQVMIGAATNGINVVDLTATLGNGYHRLVAEVQPLSGGGWVSSTAATTASERLRRIYADLDQPTIVSVTSPSDTQPPVGALNIAEQKAVPRVYSIAYESTEGGRADLYVNGTIVNTRTITAGITTLDVTLPEGNPQIWVVVTDLVGNTSPASPGQGATTYQPLVDVTSPTLAFSRPNASPLRQGDNLDVILGSNAEGQTVTVLDAGVEVASAAVTNGVATFQHATANILTEGSHTLTATVSDAAGNPAQAATTPETILVDTVGPLGAIIEPPGTTQLTDLDDSAPGTAGFQVRVLFSTTSGAVNWSIWTAKGCNISFQNCQAPVQRLTGPVTNPDGQEPAVDVTLDLDSILTQHKIILRTEDATGNTHSAEVNIQVLVLSCAVSFRNLPASGWYNASACGGPASCTEAATTIQVGFVGPCGANRVTLYNQGTEVQTVNNPPLITSFPFTVFDGVGLSLEARAFNGNQQLGSTGVVAVGVDLVPPAVDFVTTNLNGFTTPADGQDYTWTAANDADPVAPGFQLHAAVRIVDANVEGGAITILQSTGTGAPVALTPSNGSIPFPLTGASPLTQPLFDLTLPDTGQQTVLVTARDIAGNVDSSSFTATADAGNPDTVEITGSSVDPRRPLVGLTWTAVGDDGQSGLPAGYEVRYSRFPLTEANWASACNASTVYGSDVIPAPVPAGQSMSASFGAPDTRAYSDPCKFSLWFFDGSSGTTAALYIGVRAVDELGNMSPLGSQSIKTVTRGEIDNRVKRVRFSNANNAFGATNLSLLSRRGSVLGDINNDGRVDWASYSANSQALCIFLGRADQPDDLVVDTLSSPTHACLLGTQMGTIFAGATQTGHFVRPLGDVNGDGIGDFTVAGKISNGTNNAASEAYMLVYFGRDGVLPDLLQPNIRIRGIRSLTGSNEYIGVCTPGDFDGAGPVSTNDIAFGEPFASRLHVIPGRTTWTAATNLTINLTPVFPTPGGTALVDNGAWTVETTGTWGITASAPAGSPPLLGLRCGTMGDVLPTPAGLGSGSKDDLFVYQSGSLDARVFIFPGRTWTAGTVEQVSECVTAGCTESPPNVVTAEDPRAVRLRQDNDKLCTGFGAALQGGIDFTGDGIADLIATHPSRAPDFPTAAICSLPDGKSVFVFDGAKLASFVGQDLRIGTNGQPLVEQAWSGTNGWILRSSVNGQPLAARSLGDFDGWETGNPAQGTFDIAIGNRLGNTVLVRLNHVRPGLSIPQGQMPVVDGELRSPYSAADNSLGEWVDGGADFTNDGLPDLLTGARTGEVLIIY